MSSDAIKIYEYTAFLSCSSYIWNYYQNTSFGWGRGFLSQWKEFILFY